jgi:hypothetical protein
MSYGFVASREVHQKFHAVKAYVYIRLRIDLRVLYLTLDMLNETRVAV